MCAHACSTHHPPTHHLVFPLLLRSFIVFVWRVVLEGGEAVGERGDRGSELSARNGAVPRPVASVPDQGPRQTGSLEAGEMLSLWKHMYQYNIGLIHITRHGMLGIWQSRRCAWVSSRGMEWLARRCCPSTRPLLLVLARAAHASYILANMSVRRSTKLHEVSACFWEKEWYTRSSPIPILCDPVCSANTHKTRPSFCFVVAERTTTTRPPPTGDPAVEEPDAQPAGGVPLDPLHEQDPARRHLRHQRQGRVPGLFVRAFTCMLVLVVVLAGGGGGVAVVCVLTCNVGLVSSP